MPKCAAVHSLAEHDDCLRVGSRFNVSLRWGRDRGPKVVAVLLADYVSTFRGDGSARHVVANPRGHVSRFYVRNVC
jgi:hypothetical protein